MVIINPSIRVTQMYNFGLYETLTIIAPQYALINGQMLVTILQ
jgi:hypothetical protein